MCEFCNDPASNNNANRDALHQDFAGFFSSTAIEAAVQQANNKNASRTTANTTAEDDDEGEGDDSDGT